MINSKITPHTHHNSSFVDKCPINHLPADCLNHIFQYCSNPEVESFTKVSTQWKKVIIYEKHKEFLLLLNFSQFLSNELKEDKVISNKFSDIIDSYNILSSPVSLKQVKIYIGKLKNKIASTLKILKIDELTRMRYLTDKQSQPYFSNLLYLAKIEKEIDGIILLPPYEKNESLVKIAQKLIKKGYISKAIEVADLLTNHPNSTTNKDYIFKLIFNSCLDNENFIEAKKFSKMLGMFEYETLCENLEKSRNNLDIDKFIFVAKMIPAGFERDIKLTLLFDFLIMKKELDKAIKIFKTESWDSQRFSIQTIFKLLIESGRNDEAKQAINNFGQGQIIDEVFKHFIEKGAIDFGFEALKLGGSGYGNSFALHHILDLYIKNKNMDKALDVLIIMFSHSYVFEYESLLKIGKLDKNLEDYILSNQHKPLISLFFEVVFQEGKAAKVVEAVKKLSYSAEDLSIKEKVFNYLLETENLNMAIDVFNSIRTGNLKFIKPLFKLLIKTQSMDRAEEIFPKSYSYDDTWNQTYAFNEVSELLIKSGNIDKVLDIYKLLSDRLKKEINVLSLLAKNKRLKKAFEIVHTCPDHQRGNALKKVNDALSDLYMRNIKFIDFNYVEQALEIVELVPDENQEEALHSIITSFFEKNGIRQVDGHITHLMSKPRSSDTASACSIQ